MNTTNGPEALPELSDDRIDELEAALFAGIAHERTVAQTEDRRRTAARRRRRTITWWTTSAAAVVVVCAVAVGPMLGGMFSASPGGVTADRAYELQSGPMGVAEESAADGGDDADVSTSGGVAAGPVAGTVSPADREMIATADATVRVDDVAAAAQAVSAAATKAGGYVESMRIGKDGVVVADEYWSDPELYPYPPSSGAWITIRVPAAELTGAVSGLAEIGDVESSSITRDDVTQQAVDLRARVGALEASVERLTELMGKAGSVADLITAESALSERQAELDSYRQQLESLEGQVAMSTLTVSLVTTTEVAKADPAGFGDGLATGWSGLIATLNGLVVAIGFLIPWIAVLGVIGGIVWLIIRARRRSNAKRSADDEDSLTVDA